MTKIPVTRALVSVSDKAGLVPFVRRLAASGVEIVSSGGTAETLVEAGLEVVTVTEVTGSPEMLGGRVKTLHPRIHGGILADLGLGDHREDLDRAGIEPFQLVVTNLYPFREAAAQDLGHAEVIEQIDIGGPAMVRAAAKNHAWVGIVTGPDQYDEVADAVENGGLTDDLRVGLARAAFFHTAAYDAAIVNWLEAGDHLPARHVLALERAEELRYGENPHQRGGRYRESLRRTWLDGVRQHGGVPMSYLNLFDTAAAWQAAHDLAGSTGTGAVVVVKHANPCGAAVGDGQDETYQRAYECDERSAFGGIVAFSGVLTRATVERMAAAAQADVVIAPGYETGTVEALAARRRNTRVLEATFPDSVATHLRQINGAYLLQDAPRFESEDWRVVTDRSPTQAEMVDARFAWRVCGHTTSNAIVLAHSGTAWGIGAGQQNRVESGSIAVAKAAGRAAGGAMASDAFLPFPDGLDAAVSAGSSVVVQPGGAMRDAEVIARADELGLAMVFTGERQFRH